MDNPFRPSICLNCLISEELWRPGLELVGAPAALTVIQVRILAGEGAGTPPLPVPGENSSELNKKL